MIVIAKGVALPNSSTVLAMVEVAYQDCQGSKTDACSYVLCIETSDAGLTWRVRSEVSSAGNEVAVLRLGDGRLLAVMRHDCELDNSTGMVSWRYKQQFSTDEGATWGAPSLMTGRTAPPHSVLPTLRQLEGGRGYLLGGGRGGFFLWHCPDVICIDSGKWSATNLGAHHNKAVVDPFGVFPKECVDDANWNHSVTGQGHGACPSKAYIGLIPLREPGSFLACYGHCGQNSTAGWCYQGWSLRFNSDPPGRVLADGPGDEVFCVRGEVAAMGAE